MTGPARSITADGTSGFRRPAREAGHVGTGNEHASRGAASRLSVALVTCFLTSIHIQIFHRFPIPFPLAIACAFLLLVVHRKDTRQINTCLIGAFILLSLATVLFSPRQSYLATKLLSFGNLATSALCGLAFFTAISSWPARFAERYFLVLVLILVIGPTAENMFAPVKALSEAYRAWNFPLPFENDLRDIYLHGGIRPKFFTLEPSHVAKMFVVVLTLWYCLSDRAWKLALAIVLVGVLSWSLRAPSLMPAIVLLLAHAFLFPRDAGIPLPPQLTRVALFNLLIVAAIVLVFFADALNVGRINQIIEGRDASFTIRIVAPFTIIPELLSHAPFLGIGVGGMDAYVTDTIVPHFSNAGIFMQRFLEDGTADKIIQNVLAEYVVVYGAAGSLIGFAILARLVKVNAPGMVLFFFINLAAYGLIIGGLVTIRFWLFVFALLFAAASVSKRRGSHARVRKDARAVRPAPWPVRQGMSE